MWQQGANNTTDATLLECLDNLVMMNRDPVASLRLCVLDRYVERGTISMGKIERVSDAVLILCKQHNKLTLQGTLTVGDPLIIMPTRMESECLGIQVEDDWVRRARVGDNVKVKLSAVGIEDVLKGFVICSQVDVCQAVTEFTAQVLAFQ
jgi:translation elongation factor EF-1alpha